MKTLLVLEDGFALVGRSFTGAVSGGGEVIFSTNMTGYQELLSDPCHRGQMVCMTWPLIGNYGVNEQDMQSEAVQVAALLVKECCKQPSNWRCTMSLPDFLRKHGVPGVEGLDTRALTLHLRQHGSMRGVIASDTDNVPELVARARALPPLHGRNLTPEVAPREPRTWIADARGQGGRLCPASLNADGSYTWHGSGVPLLACDFGGAWSIWQMLAREGFEVLVMPPECSAAAARASGARAVFLSHGPGDPAAMPKAVAGIRELLGVMPLAGLGLGHQLLGLALGGSSYRLPFGHHGCNHPVKNLETGQVEIASQSHDFCVTFNDVPDVRLTHVNLHDGSVEGFAHRTLPLMATQHQPEATSGSCAEQGFLARFRKLAMAGTGA